VRRGCELGAAAVTALGATAAVLPRTRLQPIVGTPPRPWPFLDEKLVLETRIFKIESRRLVSPRTGLPRDFSLIRCPDWCNIVALTDANEVVMVRQVRHGVGEVTLELPGGMVDPEDATALEACQRELLEETGYAGVGGRIAGVIEPNPAMQTNRCHTAIVRGARKVAEQSQDAGEDLEVVLVPYREIPERIARGEISHALVVVAFAWTLGLQAP
jgi:ADP-ribose pyrophosphatase